MIKARNKKFDLVQLLKCPDDKYRDADQLRRHATPMQMIIAQ